MASGDQREVNQLILFADTSRSDVILIEAAVPTQRAAVTERSAFAHLAVTAEGWAAVTTGLPTTFNAPLDVLRL